MEIGVNKKNILDFGKERILEAIKECDHITESSIMNQFKLFQVIQHLEQSNFQKNIEILQN